MRTTVGILLSKLKKSSPNCTVVIGEYDPTIDTVREYDFTVEDDAHHTVILQIYKEETKVKKLVFEK